MELPNLDDNGRSGRDIEIVKLSSPTETIRKEKSAAISQLVKIAVELGPTEISPPY